MAWGRWSLWTVHTNHVNLCNKFHLWGVLLALFFWRTLAGTALLSFFIGSSGFQTILLPNWIRSFASDLMHLEAPCFWHSSGSTSDVFGICSAPRFCPLGSWYYFWTLDFVPGPSPSDCHIFLDIFISLVTSFSNPGSRKCSCSYVLGIKSCSHTQGKTRGT